MSQHKDVSQRMRVPNDLDTGL